MPTCCCGRSANRRETGAIACGGGGRVEDNADDDDDKVEAVDDDDGKDASAVCVLCRSNECVAQKRVSIGCDSSRSAELVKSASPA